MELGLKWVHMARYGLILTLDGALWLSIISKPILTLKTAMEGSKIHNQKESEIEILPMKEARAHCNVEALDYCTAPCLLKPS